MQRRLEEERRIQEMKAEMKKLKKTEERRGSREDEVRVKLSNLVISQFEGTHLDWFRSWNQCETQIDKSGLSPISKFSYVKDLLAPKARVLIDDLPFTKEGYERAKVILKSKFGKPSEVAKAHIENVIPLPAINNSNPGYIHYFYEKLVTSVQSLESMGKLQNINGFVRHTLDTLSRIRSELVRFDDDWQEWTYGKLVEALKKWTERKPVQSNKKLSENNPKRVGFDQYPRQDKPEYNPKRDRVLHSKESTTIIKGCVYCEGDHRSAECQNISSTNERKKVLSEKRLCFNCTGKRPRAINCTSKHSCQICSEKHHTSICDSGNQVKLTKSRGYVTYPLIVIKVEGVISKALIDSGSGSSYVSAVLASKINKKPKKKEPKKIEMMFHTTTKWVEIYDVTIQNIEVNFELSHYPHLNDIKLNDIVKKKEFPEHVILDVSDYANIIMQERPRVEQPGDPIAELS